jgi:hypothetical protein
MRAWILFPIAVMMLSAESVPSAKKDAKPKAAPAAAAKVTKIPDGAVQIDASSYRYTAPDGKTKLYVKTPFGIMSADEQAMTPAAANSHADETVKATLDGDTVRFERPSPFGTFRWQRKVTELTDEERAVWQAQNARSGSASAQD